MMEIIVPTVVMAKISVSMNEMVCEVNLCNLQIMVSFACFVNQGNLESNYKIVCFAPEHPVSETAREFVFNVWEAVEKKLKSCLPFKPVEILSAIDN